MDEAEWLACTDPRPMLELLRGKASDRKLRLFACACCRQVWHLLTHEWSRRALEVSEHYADGQVTVHQLATAHAQARDTVFGNTAQAAVFAAAGMPLGRAPAKATLLQAQAVAKDAAWAAAKEPWDTLLYASTPAVRAAAWAAARDSTHASQAALLRCIVGNPLCPPALDFTLLNWGSGLIRQLVGHLPCSSP